MEGRNREEDTGGAAAARNDAQARAAPAAAGERARAARLASAGRWPARHEEKLKSLIGSGEGIVHFAVLFCLDIGYMKIYE